MRIAVISDIHGNLEALKKALKIISKQKVEKIICLGDIVGYGVDSKECYEILKSKNCDFIIGNHEAMHFDMVSSDSCSDKGKISVQWQKNNVIINKEQTEFKEYIRIDKCVFAHSCLGKDGYMKYLNKLEDILEAYKNEKIVFYGHTHRPRITLVKEDGVQDTFIKKTTTISLEQDDIAYINIGSIGQQRDDRTDSYFVILDMNDEQKIQLKLYRVRYNSLKTYLKLNKYPELSSIATYLIREKFRRKIYEFINHWWNRIYRKKTDSKVNGKI